MGRGGSETRCWERTFVGPAFTWVRGAAPKDAPGTTRDGDGGEAVGEAAAMAVPLGTARGRGSG